MRLVATRMGCGVVTAMTAADVRAALAKRWPDDKYLHIEEAPLDSSRQGTKIDVLVIGLWRSLGHSLDAVEVKVSYQDWKNEIQRVEWTVAGRPGMSYSTRAQAVRARDGHGDERESWWAARRQHACYGLPERVVIPTTAKSVLWRKHCDRFWVAAPLDLAVRIRDEAPEGWGVLGCTTDGTRELAKPAKLTPTPFTWAQTIGLLRTAADCGFQALQRAESRGFTAGRKAAQVAS